MPDKFDKAAADTTVAMVKQYGVVGLFDGKKDAMKIASEATNAICMLDSERLDLATMMISSTRMDDSFESITFETFSKIEGATVVTLVQRVRYKQFQEDIPRREDRVTYGPLIPAAKAEALLAVLNS